jgi:uncharacterized protein YbcC (UPF0753/DUF2309 family)
MQEASFTGLFRNIIYIIGFYYLVKFLARLFMPMIINKAVHKAQENIHKKQSQYQTYNENEINNQNNKTGNPKSNKQVGDYIDYEEVE